MIIFLYIIAGALAALFFYLVQEKSLLITKKWILLPIGGGIFLSLLIAELLQPGLFKAGFFQSEGFLLVIFQIFGIAIIWMGLRSKY